MARRTSYASALAGPGGSANPNPRSGFIYGSSTAGAPHHSPHALSGSGSFSASPPLRAYGGRQSSPDSFERDSPIGHATRWSSSLGGTMAEPRTSPFFIPSYLRSSRLMDRLEEKHKTREKAQREGRPARSSTGGGGMSRSSSGVNLQKMVPSHRGMTYEIQEKSTPGPEDATMPLPSRWNPQAKSAVLELSADGAEVRVTGQYKTASKDDAAVVRADNPIPRACGIYYFEITIFGRVKEEFATIGIVAPSASLNRPPGWEPNSYAYHGDDGLKFGGMDDGIAYGPRFGDGDIVGCGVDFRTNSVFFTKNGIHNGMAFKDIKGDKLYPAVGLKKVGEQVRVNFGQEPFAFNIDGMVEGEREDLRKVVDREDATSLHPQGASESQLMQELVGQYLSQEGYTETAKAFAAEVKQSMTLLKGAEAAENSTIVYKDDPNANKRQKIRSAILEGQVQEAINLTDRWYPNVLRDNETIYFKLRCRKFIELIKKSTDLQPRKVRRQSSASISTALSLKRHSKRLSKSSVVGTNGSGHQSRDSLGQMDVDREDESLIFETASGASVVSEEIQAKQNSLMNEALIYGRKLQNEFKDDPRREVKQALEDTFALIAYADARESSLAYLLGEAHRVPVAEELNSAILVSLGQSSTAALERLVKQTDVLLTDISNQGGSGALLHLSKHYMR